MDNHADDITQILVAARNGDRDAVDRLLPAVYGELRARAASYLRRERAGHTLQPTALVHEAYMRLVNYEKTDWQCRAHFFATASEAMRRILVDHARTRRRGKRGGGALQVTLDESNGPLEVQDFDVLALNEALERLAELDARQAKIVELRFFGGLTNEEIAEVMGVSERTVRSDWAHARVWLARTLAESPQE
jgi:RNA polymerase sigma-70 factor, ECF subfamily